MLGVAAPKEEGPSGARDYCRMPPMSRAEASRRVHGVVATFEQHLQYILGAALACPPGGGRPWDAVLAHYGFAPDPPQSRFDTARDLRMIRGALPDELARVLAGLQTWGQSQLADVARVPFAVEDPAFMTLAGRVSGLVYFETERHRAQVVPQKTPSVGSIFANAAATASQTPWANVQVKRVVAIACLHCGAPQETPADFVCRYCRQPMTGR
jgi:hypothetical protein